MDRHAMQAEIDRLKALLYEAVQIPADWANWFKRAREAAGSGETVTPPQLENGEMK